MNLEKYKCKSLSPRERRLSARWIGRRLPGSRIIGLVVFTVFCLAISPLVAQAQGPADAKAQLLIPPNTAGPTEVFVDVGVSEIFGIDEREEIYKVDAYLNLDWVDERLAFDPDAFGYDRKVYQDETALEMLKSEIWWPSIEIVDARGSRDRMHTSLTVYYDGEVYYRERFTVLIEQGFDLDQFPFDAHNISFRIEPFEYTTDEVIFLPAEDPIDEQWDTEEWDITYNPLHIESDLPESDDEVGFAAATADITIERIPNFYMSSFVLPLLLIVAISWAVFWMDYKTMHLADRMSVSFTSVLTVVAFDFLSSDNLPKLSYSTLLDKILTVSYIFLVLIIFENVVGYSLAKKNNHAAAQKVDNLSRWLFPLGYYLVLAITFLGTLPA
jgi:hypothetical protein